MGDLPALLQRAAAAHGDAFALQMGPRRVAVFSSPAANRAILVEQARDLSARESFGPFSWMLGDGLVRLDGVAHRRMRRLLLPPFHRDRVATHLETIRGMAREAAEAWARAGRVDGMEASRRLTLRIAARTLLGVDPGAAPTGLSRDLARLFDCLMIDPRRPSTLLGSLHMAPLPLIPNLRARLDRRLFRLIAERRLGGDREDILGMLLDATDEAGRPLGDREIRDQLITFLVAGHDTTAMGLTWSLYEVARRAEIADRLRAAPEGDETFLEAVIDETLRLYPPIPLGIRRAVAPVEIDGYAVARGDSVVYSPFLTHRDPALWPVPGRFDPERFLGERPDRYAYLPFGAGAHLCLGLSLARLELRVVLTTLLRHLDWSLVDPAPPRLTIRPTLAPAGGLPLDVTRAVPA